VFINKTLSTESLINQLLIRGLAYQLLLIVGKLGPSMRSCKCTSHDLYAGGRQWQWQVCVSNAMVSVCMSRWVCVCMSFQLLAFKLSSGCLFSPHHVNQGGVQNPTPPVTLYEPHTAEESLRRHSQVLPGHPGQARELLHVLLPPHQRVCVKSLKALGWCTGSSWWRTSTWVSCISL
jgi:hypothetical protein